MLNFILIYFSVFLFCISDSIQNFTELSPVKQFHSLALCMCKVSKQDFYWKPTIVINVGEDQSGSKSEFVTEIIEVFAQKNTPFFMLTSPDSEAFDINHGNYFYVEYFDPSNTLYDFKFDALQRGIKYLWVLENYSENFFADDDFIRIGRLVGEYDVIFFVKTIELEHKMITFLPAMDEITCTVNFYPYQINRCDHGSLETSVIFPSKNPTNIMGCALKVGIGTEYPMAMIENQESLTLNTYDSLRGIEVKGTDVEIIKIVSEFSNASMDLYYTLVYAENHFIYDHYLPFLLNGSLDVCAGGQYRIFGDRVEYSGVYTRMLVNWIYTADRPPLTWQNLILNIDGLYLFIIFYLIYSLLWCVICVFDKYAVSMNDTLLYSWGALLGTTSLPEAGTLKQKVLNLCYLYMCLHLSVYISIDLFSYFTISGPTEILRTNEDVMKSGRMPYLNSLDKYFIRDDKYEVFVNTSVECTTFLDCTTMILENKGLTIIIDSYIYQLQDEIDTIVNDEAKLLKPTENLLTVYHEMVIRKDSPIVGVLQKVVKRLFEAGITFKLYKDAIGITKVDKTDRAARNIIYPKYSCQDGCPINFEQISGALYLWAIGCGLALALFVAELLYGARELLLPNRLYLI